MFRFFTYISYIFRVWRANARASIVREMEFRANFFSGIFRQLLWLSSFVLFIEVIFQNTQSLSGWSKPEVLVVLALSRLIEGIIDTLFNRNLGDFPYTVQKGTFDYYLTKPVPVQFYAAFHRVNVASIGNVIAGIALLIYSLVTGHIALSFLSFVLFFFLALAGISIYYGILIATVSAVFYLERFQAFNAISHLISEPLTVPFDVFPYPARTALTYLIPIAFVVFVPAQAITGRLAAWQVPLAIGIAALFLAIANYAWRAGLRRYSSASS